LIHFYKRNILLQYVDKFYMNPVINS